MAKLWDILVVSARLENKRTLLRILQGLPVSAFTASTLKQAHEVLSTHSIQSSFARKTSPMGLTGTCWLPFAPLKRGHHSS